MRLLIFRQVIWLKVLLLLALGSNAAFAADAGWDWRLTPLYYWSLNIEFNESAGEGGPPTEPPILPDPFRFSFEGAFSTNFQGVYDDRWGFMADIIWANIASSNSKASLDLEYLQTELDGFYRSSFDRHSVDWIVGARYYGVETKLEPTPLTSDESWVDPLVGVRWNWAISETWSTTLRGDVGGFGIGSDLSLQGIATVDWHPWQHVSLTGGLRALSVEYETGKGIDNYTLDLTVWGPLLGVSFRW